MDAELRERAQIESDLREAIRQELIVPHFQPLVDLQSGAIVGFEALARWDHPRHGNIPPVKFIAIAEDCGLIQELGLSMLRQACRHAQGWAPELTLSVNISPIQLRDPWLAEKIVSVLLETGLPAARVFLDVFAPSFRLTLDELD